MSEEEKNCDNDTQNLLKKPARALEVKNEDLTDKIYIIYNIYRMEIIPEGKLSGRNIRVNKLNKRV